MKRLMIIAVIISGMLIPAQGFAQNGRKIEKRENRIQIDKKGQKRNDKFVKNDYKPQNVKRHKVSKAPMAIHHNPHPQKPHIIQCAPPPKVVHHHCNNNVVEAAAIAIGVAGLISILAD